MLRQLVLATVLVVVPLTACSKRQPPAQPGPVMPDTAGEGARRAAADRERARQDSIARANAAADAARRAGAEATARARAVLEEIVYFDYDESSIRADSREALGRKVPILRANPTLRIRIAGHADERGSVEYNLALGMRRATAVREYLAGFGIDAGRLDIHSFGEDVPLDRGTSDEAYARNRRAEFTITAGGDVIVMPGN